MITGGGKQNDQLLRSRLLSKTIKYLTEPRYVIEGDEIIYGRFIDDPKKIMSVDDLVQSISKYRALIDPFDNPFDIRTAETLNQTLQNDILKQIIIKTRARTIENKDIVNRLLNIDIDSFTGPVGKLNLWSKRG